MVLAGKLARAADVNVPSYISKSGSESVTSSTTLQDDDHFTVTLPVGTYWIELVLTATGAAAGDIKTAWTNTGTTTVIGRSVLGPTVGAADVSAASMNSRGVTFTSNQSFGTDGTNSSHIHEWLLIDVTVEGVLTLQWAQAASSGTATTLSTSSRMLITKVEASS
jgi:hypothetical protein